MDDTETDALIRKLLADLRDNEQRPDPEAARLQAAADAGLPADLAKRLQGDTPEELAVDAHKLAELIPKAPPTHGEVLLGALADNRAKHRDLIESMHPHLTGDDDA